MDWDRWQVKVGASALTIGTYLARRVWAKRGAVKPSLPRRAYTSFLTMVMRAAERDYLLAEMGIDPFHPEAFNLASRRARQCRDREPLSGDSLLTPRDTTAIRPPSPPDSGSAGNNSGDDDYAL